MAERLTWLLNGCYLWEGEVDSANIVHSRFASLLLFSPFSLPPPPPPPEPELLVVMAVMTEKTKRREIVEMGGGGGFGKGAGGKKELFGCEMLGNRKG